jgi:hypothetical protein
LLVFSICFSQEKCCASSAVLIFIWKLFLCIFD